MKTGKKSCMFQFYHQLSRDGAAIPFIDMFLFKFEVVAGQKKRKRNSDRKAAVS